MSTRIVFLVLLISVVFVSLSSSVHAKVFEPEPIQINVPLVEGRGAYDDISTYLQDLYQFSLGAGAIVAMAMIVIGGIQWVLAAGNITSTQGAKKRINSAIFGLVLLLGATLLLFQINPEITDLNTTIVDTPKKPPPPSDALPVPGSFLVSGDHPLITLSWVNKCLTEPVGGPVGPGVCSYPVIRRRPKGDDRYEERRIGVAPVDSEIYFIPPDQVINGDEFQIFADNPRENGSRPSDWKGTRDSMFPPPPNTPTLAINPGDCPAAFLDDNFNIYFFEVGKPRALYRRIPSSGPREDVLRDTITGEHPQPSSMFVRIPSTLFSVDWRAEACSDYNVCAVTNLINPHEDAGWDPDNDGSC
jgi:hypothetical protein